MKFIKIALSILAAITTASIAAAKADEMNAARILRARIGETVTISFPVDSQSLFFWRLDETSPENCLALQNEDFVQAEGGQNKTAFVFKLLRNCKAEVIFVKKRIPLDVGAPIPVERRRFIVEITG